MDMITGQESSSAGDLGELDVRPSLRILFELYKAGVTFAELLGICVPNELDRSHREPRLYSLAQWTNWHHMTLKIAQNSNGSMASISWASCWGYSLGKNKPSLLFDPLYLNMEDRKTWASHDTGAACIQQQTTSTVSNADFPLII